MTALERHQPQMTPERLSKDELAFIINSELIPRAYRGKKADIFACVLLGRQLGIGDMHALRSIYVVDGKASISAELMVTLTRQRGHSITADSSEGKVVVKGKRADNGDTMTVAWTTKMAERAGLLTKDNWKKYPEAMLWARAVSQLCRQLFPDVLSGVSYTPDEAELSAEDRVTEAIGEVSLPKDNGEPDDVIDAEAEEVVNGNGDDGDPGPDEPSAEETHEAELPADVVIPMDEVGQASMFEGMAEKAQETRRKREKAT